VASLATPPPALSVPPTAPDVAEQQGPLAQYVQNQDASAADVQQAPKQNASALVERKMNEVAGGLKEVATLLVSNFPDLMPILEKMLQAGSMIMNQIQTNQKQAGRASSQRQASPTPTPGQTEAPPPA